MIKTIFIIQLISLAVAFADEFITKASDFHGLGIAGKMACVIILVGFLVQIVLLLVNVIKGK